MKIRLFKGKSDRELASEVNDFILKYFDIIDVVDIKIVSNVGELGVSTIMVMYKGKE